MQVKSNIASALRIKTSSDKKITEVLKYKLKLDDNIIGLLVNSKGSIKSKSFFNNVSRQILKF